MIVPGSASALLLRTADTGYKVERSLRFNSSDSAFCSRSVSSAGSRTTWTWAGWVKKSGNGAYQALFTSTRSGFETLLMFDNSDRLYLYNWVSNAFAGRKLSTSIYRDPSAWYHIVAVWDSTNATAADRCRLYVNGVRLTAFNTSTDPGSSEQTTLNDAYAHQIGNYAGGGSAYYLNGYLADVHFIDGQALDPSSFTEVSATTGQLIPKAYTGSFGTNGFWLQFADNSSNTATTLGKDTSGNGNNWTPNNLSVTAGSGNDSLVDTPTSYGTDDGLGGSVRGNYCTWNPLLSSFGTPTLTDGNLVNTAANTVCTGTIGMPSSGKYYGEISTSGSGGVGGSGGIVAFVNGARAAIGKVVTGANAIVGVAVDRDAGDVKIYVNGVLDSTTALSSVGITASHPVFFEGYVGTPYVGPCTLNAGQRPFAYTAPSGFKALCDTNLPAPVVAKPSTVMDVKLYTGNGSTQTISGLGFSPDLIWFKSRSNALSHTLTDSVRGRLAYLMSDTTGSEGLATDGYHVNSFNSDGFTLGLSWINGVNASGVTNAAWCWDAGSSTVTNTQGSITSQVRANASAGFSIVTYTGNGTSGATVGHGLGVAPSLIIVKNRDQNVSSWDTYHRGANATPQNGLLRLNSTAAFATASDIWNNTAPASTVFSLGNSDSCNGNTIKYVAYCFAPVAGYSSAFSYTGNGSADGPMVYLGFRPRYLIFKRTDTAEDWLVLDSARDSYNVASARLLPNSSAAEGTGFHYVDFLSNGFKIRNTQAGMNASNGTFVGFAFAESPFQYARAR